MRATSRTRTRFKDANINEAHLVVLYFVIIGALFFVVAAFYHMIWLKYKEKHQMNKMNYLLAKQNAILQGFVRFVIHDSIESDIPLRDLTENR